MQNDPLVDHPVRPRLAWRTEPSDSAPTLALRTKPIHPHHVRTTLDIDPDVLEAVREMSVRSRRTAGKILSELAREGLVSVRGASTETRVVNGFEILPADGRVVTPERVRQLMDESEDA